MTDHIPGASVWEQELYDHVSRHIEGEISTLKAYEALANSTESQSFRYLASLILDDERRHHKVLTELAETIRLSAQLASGPIPYMDLYKHRDELLEPTERFLALEEEDLKELTRLEKELRDMRDTSIWPLLLKIISLDNEKHRTILKFIRDRARHE